MGIKVEYSKDIIDYVKSNLGKIYRLKGDYANTTYQLVGLGITFDSKETLLYRSSTRRVGIAFLVHSNILSNVIGLRDPSELSRGTLNEIQTALIEIK